MYYVFGLKYGTCKSEIPYNLDAAILERLGG